MTRTSIAVPFEVREDIRQLRIDVESVERKPITIPDLLRRLIATYRDAARLPYRDVRRG